MRIVIIALLATLVSALAADPGEARSKPAIKVVVSILPLHSLVAGVMAGMGEPHLLVPGGASPHSFALRPSDARRLEQAQAVFWVGPQLETFLERPLNALARNADIVAMSSVDGVTLLPFREGGPWEGHDHAAEEAAGGKDHDHAHGAKDALEEHGHEENGKDDHDHGDHHGNDAHVWLDPLNAIAFVKATAQALGRIDPENAARYDLNAKAVVARLQALDAALRAQLGPAQGKPYIVFHDGYHYFEDRYGLTPVGSITVSPELSPGAKRLVEIRGRIRKEAALCIFAEPQFEPKLVRTVAQGTGARTATLDPLGAQLTPGPDAYFHLMRNLAKDLTACLSATN